MIRRPPRSTRTDTLLPYTTLFRSQAQDDRVLAVAGGKERSLARADREHLALGVGDAGKDADQPPPVVLAPLDPQGHPVLERSEFVHLDRKSTRLNSSH